MDGCNPFSHGWYCNGWSIPHALPLPEQILHHYCVYSCARYLCRTFIVYWCYNIIVMNKATAFTFILRKKSYQSPAVAYWTFHGRVINYSACYLNLSFLEYSRGITHYWVATQIWVATSILILILTYTIILSYTRWKNEPTWRKSRKDSADGK
jgi:hypothetical protein